MLEPCRQAMTARWALLVVLILALIVSGSPAAGAAGDFHSRWLDQSPWPVLAPGATTTYTLHFRNTGTATWVRGTSSQANLGVTGDLTTYSDLGLNVGWLSANRLATTAEATVAPGGTATFTFTLRAPLAAASYRIPLRVVIDGLTWLEDEGVFVVLVSDAGFHSKWVAQTPWPSGNPGDKATPITLSFRNTGQLTWVKGLAGQEVRLGIVGDDNSWAPYGLSWPLSNRVALMNEASVGTGAIATFTFALTFPQTPGSYPLRLRPVVDGVTWLEDEGVYVLVSVLGDTRVPTITDVVAQSGLSIPWDLAFAPDGRLFVTELGGNVRIYASGAPGAALLSKTAIAGVHAAGEAGVMGIALDPAFATSGFLYLCVSRDDNGWLNQVLRYRVSGNALTFDGYVIRTGMYAASNHDGCRIRFGADGKLWVTMGEAGNPMFSQNPAALNGKILRVNADGSIPSDNPIMPGQATATAVYTMGHRNPQGIAFQPVTGQAFAIEHAHYVDHTTSIASHATVMRLEAGGNYSWPYGSAPQFKAPVWQSHNSPYVATSGGSFVADAKWGAWRGNLFLAALTGEMILRLGGTPDGMFSLADTLYVGKYGRLRAVVEGPDGALYLTTSNGSGDRIIRVTPG